MRLFLIPLDFLSNTNPLAIKPEARTHFINSSILIEENTLTHLKPRHLHQTDPSHLRILMTHRCNSNCSYCYGSSTQRGEDLDPAILQKLLASINTEKIDRIEMHGNGEPTINFKLFKEVYKILTAKFPNHRMSTQTNGLFDKKTAKWLLSNKVDVGFSLDGPEFIHNKQRPCYNNKVNSFKKTYANLKLFQQNGKGTFAISVITEYNLAYMEDIYDFLYQEGIKSMKINPLRDVGRANSHDSPEFRAPDINKFCSNLAKIQLKAIAQGILVDSDFIPAFYRKPASYYACNACSPQLVLDTSGAILSCSAGYCSSEKDTNPFFWAELNNCEFKIFEKNKKLMQERAFNNIPACEECFIKWHCSGACLIENYAVNNDISKPVTLFCEARRRYALEYFTGLISQFLP